MLPTIENIKSYYIYTYTFLDDLSYIKSPYDHFSYEERKIIDDAIHLIEQRFTEYGWEGDGSIGIMWLPPFVDTGREDTFGTYVWHVKQSNDGISFLACHEALDSKRLREQNEEKSIHPERKGLTPISIIQTDVDWFKKAIDDIENNLRLSLSYLEKGPSPEIVNTIKDNLNTYFQGLIVRNFLEFLDECYLRFLIEVIDNSNPFNIKLSKSKVNLDLNKYIPELDDGDPYDTASDNSWFTLKGLISDMWKAYKWEPFKSKIDMLFKSIDYKPDEKHMQEIKKHVILRNCMQHHEGCLDKDSLSVLGCSRVTMQGGKSLYHIEVWKRIIFSEHEICAFCGILRLFLDHFHTYVKLRVPTIHYLSKP